MAAYLSVVLKLNVVDCDYQSVWADCLVCAADWDHTADLLRPSVSLGEVLLGDI